MPSTKQRPRWQEYMPIDELVEAARNPKGHDDQLIGESFERFGFIEPIVMDERTGRLVAGHGRLHRLLREHGEGREPPEGVTRGRDRRWRVPVDRGWSSIDDEEAFAAGVVLNRAGERGGWKRDELGGLLDELRAGRGLAGVGYTPGDVDDLLKSLAPPVAPDEFQPVPDVLPTEHQCPKCGYEWSGGSAPT